MVPPAGPRPEHREQRGVAAVHRRDRGSAAERRRRANANREKEKKETMSRIKRLEQEVGRGGRMEKWFRHSLRVTRRQMAAAVVGMTEYQRRRRFHSTTVKVVVEGGEDEGYSALADGGAFAGVSAAHRVRHLAVATRGVRDAGGAVTANGAPLGESMGIKRVGLRLPESSHPSLVLSYEMEAIENDQMPTLLGVDLFVHLGAKFDYATSMLELKLVDDSGEPVDVKVPFTVEREEATVAAE